MLTGDKAVYEEALKNWRRVGVNHKTLKTTMLDKNNKWVDISPLEELKTFLVRNKRDQDTD